jgi:hypothetical protein
VNSQIKGLLAKAWKNEETDLLPGRHDFDEVVVVHVRGSVEKFDDQLVAPTVSIPLVTTLALFWEKAGIARDEAMRLLREAILDAMQDGVNEDQHIKQRIDDVAAAMEAIKTELIGQLPKMARSGKVVTKELKISVSPLKPEQLAVA